MRYNDQVKFESLKTKGQFLHCSNHRYKDKFHVLKRWLVHLNHLAINFTTQLLLLLLLLLKPTVMN